MFNFQQKFNISQQFSSVFGGVFSSKGSRILMYHSLEADVAGDLHQIYQIDKNLFQQQINWLARSFKDRVLPLSEYLKSDGISITFDDGYRDTLEIAAPILLQHNLPFTVFVAPGLIESKDIRYLDKSMLKRLSEIEGCTIGAHGYQHVPLTKCNDSQLSQELRDSKAWLEDCLSQPILTMSYPHGSVDLRVRDAARDAGYNFAASSDMGSNKPDCDPLWLNRVDIWSVDQIDIFEQKVNGKWDWMRWLT